MSTRRRRPHVMTLALCSALWAAAVALALPSLAAEQEKQVIARVDGEPVTGEVFEPYLRAYLRSKLYHSGSPDRMRALADEAIDAFLIDRVLAAEAAARAMKIDETVVEKRLADIKSKFGERPEWPQISERMPKLRQEIETDLRIEALKNEISRVEPPTEANVRTFYESRSDLFTRPAAYRLRLLLIAVDPSSSVETWRAAETTAQEYALRIASGEDFAVVARTHSKHNSAEQGGEIGLVHEGQLGEAAEAALRSAPTGQVVGPVRLLEGIALFRIDEKIPSAVVPFDEVKQRAVSLFERERAKDQWNSYVKTVRGRISVDQSAFAEFLASALK